MAIIKCIGAKEIKSIMNDNVDIVLNWDIEENNNFKDIIINWPKSGEYLHKKNLYLYQLKVLSIRQTFLGFHNKSTEFYIFIYDLGYEPKLSFELPMSSPKNTISGCQSLDSTTLKCIINLKERDLIEMAQLIPFKKGNQTKIYTDEKNKIIFIMNNDSEINNVSDFYINIDEECEDYLKDETFKDRPISGNLSKYSIYFIIIIFILIVVMLIICISIFYKRLSLNKMKITELFKVNSPETSAPTEVCKSFNK